MSEVFVTFPDPVKGPDGRYYIARACGSEMDESRWQGWIEFEPVDGGLTLRSKRETTQPNRVDAAYWATGLTPVYLEGSLVRTLRPDHPVPAPPPAVPAFDGPAPSHATTLPPAESVLNPFSVYRKGEDLLRRQLSALAGWHLVNIIRDYELSDLPLDEIEAMREPALIELIVTACRNQSLLPQDE